MRIRITSMPQGEAPEEVRKAWIGLELDGRLFSVLDGVPHGVVTHIRVKRNSSADFVCDSRYAVTLLRDKDPVAYKWCLDHVNFVLMPKFSFDNGCFEVVG